MKIAVLLSGGVDSSVALNLLKRRGYRDLTAFYLKVWLEDELAFLGECPWQEDLRYARAVCEQLDVPLEVVSLQSAYRDKVVEHALAELAAGRTPSPDILCNQRIKFGEFFRRMNGRCAKVASGHYARIDQRGGTFFLERGPDPVKDQTYFLSNLDQSQLRRILFPIGHLTKEEVRLLAAELDLPTRNRKDSQGICFLGKINYRDFVAFHLGRRRGDLVALESGEKLGEHQGFWFYTTGQRHGLGLGGGPWYVVRKDVNRNIVYVSHKDQGGLRQRRRFTASNLNWISGRPRAGSVQVKIRHCPELSPCRLEFLAPDRLQATLDLPDPGIAPGQHAVFYHGRRCLGGGTIE